MRWLKHYLWFIFTSKKFTGYTWWKLIKEGVFNKSFKHANSMVKWDKMTPEERELWYVNEDRTIEF
jgi:hypothetical protein